MDRGAEADFKAWVLARRASLRHAAFLMCGDWFLADDLVQESVARVYSVWPRVSVRGEPDAYARRVVVNLLIDHKRRPWRREVLVESVPDDGGGRTSGSSGEETSERLLQALASVPARQRAVLVLRFWEDLSVEQTASILNCSSGTVKSQTSRGLAALRAALPDHDLGTSPTDIREHS